jgi:hypothetical protein
MQVSRSPDDAGLTKEEFTMWAQEKFKSTKTIANIEALMRIYSQ